MCSPAVAQDTLNQHRQHTNEQLESIHPSTKTSVHARRHKNPAAKRGYPRQVQFADDAPAGYISQAAHGVVQRTTNFGKHKYPLDQPYSKLLNLTS